MNQATNVNIVPSYGQRGELHFSQYDVGRTATINLYAVNEAYTIPVGATVKIQATKPSGLGFDVACTFSGSVVTVVSTETMTEESGRFPCELQITKDSDVIGTANFMFVVEPSPHPDGTVDGDAEEVVNEIKALVLQSEGYALGTQDGVPVDNTSPYYHNNSKWWAEHPVGGGLTEDFKQALLDCFENVAWIGDDGQDYYDALYNALYPSAEVISISAVYTQGGTVYDTDSLDSLKSDLVVTATYDDTSTAEVPSADYTLSGLLTVGTSTITVSYGGKTTTFSVTVSEEAVGEIVQYEIGSVSSSDGSETSATNRIRTDFIPVSSGDLIVMGTALNYVVRVYNSSKSFTGSIPSSGWTSNYHSSVTADGYVRIVMKKSDDADFTVGEMDGAVFGINNVPYYLEEYAYPIEELKVYNGKGTSGSSIVDNANRALTGGILISDFGSPIFIERLTENNDINLDMIMKFIDSNGDVITTTAYSSPTFGTRFGIYGNFYTMLSTTGNNYTPYTPPVSAVKVRLLFANNSDTSSPLPSVPTGIVVINKRRYRLVEGTVFE